MYEEPWVTEAVKLHEVPDADTAGTAVPLELGKAVEVEPEPVDEVEEVELDPQAASARLQITPPANAARIPASFIEAGVYR